MHSLQLLGMEIAEISDFPASVVSAQLSSSTAKDHQMHTVTSHCNSSRLKSNKVSSNFSLWI